MRRGLLSLLLLLGGCSWSNSLYLARRLSHEAERTERSGRPFEAQNLWGQARTKADSAWSRSGLRNYEALGYRGLAQARLNDCNNAIPDLEASARYAGGRNWAGPVHLALGECRQQLNQPGVEEELVPLLDSSDRDIRRSAALTLARYYLAQDAWDSLRHLSPDLNDPILRFGRAVAGIALDIPVARSELEPFVAARDTTQAWEEAIEALARTRQRWADTLIAELAEGLPANDFRPLFWYSAAYRGAMEVEDTAAATGRLQRLEHYVNTPELAQAHRINAQYRISKVATLPSLAAVLDSLPVTGGEDGGANSVVRSLRRTARVLLGESDSLTGVPGGDMRLILQADDAQRTLHAPALAKTLYARVEHDWPESPYLIKAMLARMLLEPDSAEAIRSRLDRYPGPYLSVLQLKEDPRYRQLEDSLATFQRNRLFKFALIDPDGPLQ